MSSTRDPDAKSEAKNPRLFDVRTVERNIKKGLVTRKEYEKYLKALGDASEKVSLGDASDDDDDDLDAVEADAEDEAGKTGV